MTIEQQTKMKDEKMLVYGPLLFSKVDLRKEFKKVSDSHLNYIREYIYACKQSIIKNREDAMGTGAY